LLGWVFDLLAAIGIDAIAAAVLPSPSGDYVAQGRAIIAAAETPA
jgi:hypothetical protein